MADQPKKPPVWKTPVWRQFEEKIYMHGNPGLINLHGKAEKDGELQAEYVLNNVKRLRVLPSVLEDIE